MSTFRNPELIHTFKSTCKTASWKEETQKFCSSDVELSYSTLEVEYPRIALGYFVATLFY